MKPMPSLAGIERRNFQLYDWDRMMFTRVNAVFEEFVRRKRWQSVNYAANEIERLLKVWKPTTPIN
jgi:hypothetical protein